jgi:flagellar biosynthesis component FlhA
MCTDVRDLVLPIAVVSAVGMMIFPLPSVLLDVLLACNIAFALALLINSVYLSEPEKFTALPSILLLATLFRLSLNISTTRQLLGSGEAPEIVVAFGQFVVQGNIVVGIVIFAIVTLVQFLVIAKGAERVAEVSARFTLDAMPGKQMAIDADVRAGIISLTEAKEKRIELQSESKLYGSLDGAMKFVKGDAIAGLIITLINISAGLILGMTQQGLDFSHALQKYTIFTVGDGLVSQIPALLVAVAAGICVTQVGNTNGTFIGRDVLTQLSKEPQAVATTGILLMFLSLLPGLPLAPFAICAMAFLIVARQSSVLRAAQHSSRAESVFNPKVYSGFVLRLGVLAAAQLQKERDFPRLFRELREQFFEQSGVLLPELQFDIVPKLPSNELVCYLHGEKRFELTYEFERSEAKNVLLESLGDSLEKSLRNFCSKNILEFLDDTHTRMLLELHQAKSEDLINSTIPGVISVTGLTSILRQLVKEAVAIRDLRAILQAIAEYNLNQDGSSLGKDLLSSKNTQALPKLRTIFEGEAKQNRPRDLVAEVRIALRQGISRSAQSVDGKIKAWLLDPDLDQLLSEIAFSSISLSPQLRNALIEQVRSIQTISGDGERVVILCSKYARPLLANLLEGEEIYSSILAVEEVSENSTIEFKGELAISSQVESASVNSSLAQESAQGAN